jgi:hypothetical protein
VRVSAPITLTRTTGGLRTIPALDKLTEPCQSARRNRYRGDKRRVICGISATAKQLGFRAPSGAEIFAVPKISALPLSHLRAANPAPTPSCSRSVA